MITIAVAYSTESGHTEKLAKVIAQSIQDAGYTAKLINVNDLNTINWDDFYTADAIMFGSPTYMGSVAGKFKIFMDKSSHFWIEQKWKNKIAAGFTIGASTGGDKLNSLIQLSIFAAQHSMIWVGQSHVGSKHTNDGKRINDTGSWLGLSTTSNPDKSKMLQPHDVLTAEMFAQRIVETTIKWTAE